MTVSRRRKRRIEIDGRAFLWWVKEDDTPAFIGSTGHSLHVASEDGAFYIEYPLGQPEGRRHVVVKGAAFRGAQGPGGPWRRFRCPLIGSPLTVSPGDVAKLIRWATSNADPQPVEVDYTGWPVISDRR